MAANSATKLPLPPVDIATRSLPVRRIKVLFPLFECVALFDGCRSRLSVESAEPLMRGSLRTWTIDQISKYNLALQP